MVVQLYTPLEKKEEYKDSEPVPARSILLITSAVGIPSPISSSTLTNHDSTASYDLRSVNENATTQACAPEGRLMEMARTAVSQF